MTQQEIALQRENEELRRQNEIMRRLATFDGFYTEFFKELKTAPTNVAAFNTVNERYQECFGELRYSNYEGFRKALTRLKHKKE